MEEKKQTKVVIFTTPTCRYCVIAKRYFREKNIKFTDVDVSRDQRAAADMQRRTGQQGVPVIAIGSNRPLIGFDKPKINRLLNIK
ncbi:MAG: glutaredoxin domain-containing protein [Melioribacteraceae bacterium]|jgi:glutaredoxin 3|nr:glutaredoxin domain-containing protein [Melioribacteraceae bacterium]